jgi:hypothetical protein
MGMPLNPTRKSMVDVTMTSDKNNDDLKVGPQKDTARKPGKLIRDAEFAKRFASACDKYSRVPPKHSGRLVRVKNELATRFNENVSMESVRKWFAGETKPRPDKMAKLANLLEVDVAWLSLGIDHALQPRELKARNAMADGAVNVVAGLIRMDGGHPAFPSSDASDVAANVDLHAIIRGAKYDFHVSLGQAEGDQLRFTVPTNYQNMVVLGMIQRGFNLDIFEIPSEQIATGEHHGGSIDLVLSADKLNRIHDFKNRI